MRSFFLNTARIGFSKWTDADDPLAASLWGNGNVARYLCAAGVFSREDIKKRLALEMDNEAQYGFQYWPIFSLADGALIGCCGFRPHNMEKRILELGFHLLPDFWGQGYAFEAAKAAMDYAFVRLHASSLAAGHHPQNAASQRLLGKLGFRHAGDAYYAPTGLQHPSYVYTP